MVLDWFNKPFIEIMTSSLYLFIYFYLNDIIKF